VDDLLAIARQRTDQPREHRADLRANIAPQRRVSRPRALRESRGQRRDHELGAEPGPDLGAAARSAAVAHDDRAERGTGPHARPRGGGVLAVPGAAQVARTGHGSGCAAHVRVRVHLTL
jgi:hypothetical protein